VVDGKSRHDGYVVRGHAPLCRRDDRRCGTRSRGARFAKHVLLHYYRSNGLVRSPGGYWAKTSRSLRIHRERRFNSAAQLRIASGRMEFLQRNGQPSRRLPIPGSIPARLNLVCYNGVTLTQRSLTMRATRVASLRRNRSDRGIRARTILSRCACKNPSSDAIAVAAAE